MANGQYGYDTGFENQTTWDQSWQDQFGDGGQAGDWGFDSSGKMTEGIDGSAMSNVGANAADGGYWGDSFGTFDKTLGTLGKGLGAVNSLAQLGLGFAALGVMKDEMKIKQEKWDEARKELKFMQNTRKNLTASYMGNKKPSGNMSASQSKTMGMF